MLHAVIQDAVKAAQGVGMVALFIVSVWVHDERYVSEWRSWGRGGPEYQRRWDEEVSASAGSWRGQAGAARRRRK